jgi:hypothetical protein
MRQGRRPLRRPPAGLRRRHRPLGRLEADVARGLALRHDWGPQYRSAHFPGSLAWLASATTRRSWVNPRPTAAPNAGSAPSRSSACGSSCTTPSRSSARPWPASSSAPTAPGSSNGTATRLRRRPIRQLKRQQRHDQVGTTSVQETGRCSPPPKPPGQSVIGPTSAALTTFRGRAGAANAPETALDGGALVKLAGKQMASVSEAVGPFRPSPGQATGVRRGRLVPSAPPMAPMARLRSGIHTSSMIEPPRSSPTA